MPKYLDEYGVAHLWSNAKNYIDEKSSGSTGNSTFLVKAPVGTIVIWSGTSDNIPSGWQLCDGTNGTPDLRDKFVLGAGTNHIVGSAGGSESVTLTTEQLPSHNHGQRISRTITPFNQSLLGSTSGITSGYRISDSAIEVGKQGTVQNTSASGANVPHENMPPYYTLCYIMKLTADETDTLDVYSTEETRIGTWIDGKPLYRRTFSASATISPSNKNAIVATISETFRITSIKGVVYVGDSQDVYLLPYVSLGTTTGEISSTMNLIVSEYKVLIQSFKVNVSIDYSVTIEYTKTTD